MSHAARRRRPRADAEPGRAAQLRHRRCGPRSSYARAAPTRSTPPRCWTHSNPEAGWVGNPAPDHRRPALASRQGASRRPTGHPGPACWSPGTTCMSCTGAHAARAQRARLRSIVEGVAAVLWGGRAAVRAAVVRVAADRAASGYPEHQWYDPQVWLARIDAEDREHVRCSPERTAGGRARRHSNTACSAPTAASRGGARTFACSAASTAGRCGRSASCSTSATASPRSGCASPNWFDHADQGIFVDAEQRIRYVNPAFRTISGYGRRRTARADAAAAALRPSGRTLYAEIVDTLRRDSAGAARALEPAPER